MGSKRREEQPLGEEHNPEEPNQETSSWDNYRDIAGRCVSVVTKVVGLAEKHPELADFRHEAMSTAIGSSIWSRSYRFWRRKTSLDKKIALKKKNQGVS